MNELFLFVRPPRPLWPFNGVGSSFWPPLAFASLAAALRENVKNIRVQILDAPAMEMGWKSMTEEIRRRKPAYIGIGEEAVSCKEGLRVGALAREVGARVIAGGCFFGNLAPETLSTGLVDVVAHGEGEETIVELVEALRAGGGESLRAVRGISFVHGEELVRTESRPLIADLDRLPMPAYDLLPVERYGRRSRNHPALAAVELSRGCSYGCDFCILWRQMGREKDGRMIPHVRAKSPERLLEEVRTLVQRYDRRYLGWVDPCFNADPEVPRRLAELMLRENLTVGQSAWMRANYIVRDEASGALADCVRSGLNEIYMGIERLEKGDLQILKKGNLKGETEGALKILAENYPQVLKVGSFIYGVPGDTPRKIHALLRGAWTLPIDLPLYIPRTPLPGTPYWRSEYWDPTGEFFRQLDFLPRINDDPDRNLLTVALHRCLAFSWPLVRIRGLLHVLLTRDSRRRRIAWRHLARSTRLTTSALANSAMSRDVSGGMRIPVWYES